MAWLKGVASLLNNTDMNKSLTILLCPIFCLFSFFLRNHIFLISYGIMLPMQDVPTGAKCILTIFMTPRMSIAGYDYMSIYSWWICSIHHSLLTSPIRCGPFGSAYHIVNNLFLSINWIVWKERDKYTWVAWENITFTVL